MQQAGPTKGKLVVPGTQEKKVDNKGFIDTEKVKENKKVPGSKSTFVPGKKPGIPTSKAEMKKEPPYFAKGGGKNATKKRK